MATPKPKPPTNGKRPVLAIIIKPIAKPGKKR
jgi:hypothetical protein